MNIKRYVIRCFVLNIFILQFQPTIAFDLRNYLAKNSHLLDCIKLGSSLVLQTGTVIAATVFAGPAWGGLALGSVLLKREWEAQGVLYEKYQGQISKINSLREQLSSATRDQMSTNEILMGANSAQSEQIRELEALRNSVRQACDSEIAICEQTKKYAVKISALQRDVEGIDQDIASIKKKMKAVFRQSVKDGGIVFAISRKIALLQSGLAQGQADAIRHKQNLGELRDLFKKNATEIEAGLRQLELRNMAYSSTVAGFGNSLLVMVSAASSSKK